MDFRQIDQFAAVIKAGSITGAAKLLYTTQPALSRSISAMERELGIRLLDRSGKYPQLTEAGLAALHYFDEMQRSVRSMYTTLEDMKAGRIGEVRIGIAYAALDPLWQRDIVRNYVLSHPKVSLCFFQMDHAELLDRFSNRELDFGFSSSTADIPHISWIRLFDEEIGVLLGRSSPLAEKAVLRLSDLQDQTFIIINTNSDLKNMALRMFESAGLRPPTITEVDSNSVSGDLIARNRGVSIIGKKRHVSINELNAAETTIQNTTFRPLAPPFNSRTCYLGYNNKCSMNRAARILMGEFLNQFDIAPDAAVLPEEAIS